MRKFLTLLEKNEKAISLGRFCSLISFLEWCVASAWLLFTCKACPIYEIFSIVVVVFLLTQLANKVLDIRGFKVTEKENDKNG